MMIKKKKILDYLNELFPNPKPELVFTNNFELLIAVILSAQTTDNKVNIATKELFSKYPNALLLSKASITDVENIIKHIGLYKNKARFIINTSNDLVNKHNGIVPNAFNDLLLLPGVGRKTANVVISNAFNIPAFAVDTHVERVAKRLSIANENDSIYEVEMKLENYFDIKDWLKLHHQLILFGRYYCKSRNPKCSTCKLKDICSYYNNQ